MPSLLRYLTAPGSPGIFPLETPASSLSFGGKTLRDWQDEAAKACGLTVVDVPAGVDAAQVAQNEVVGACRDDVLFNAATLRHLWSEQRRRGRAVRAVVPATTALGQASLRLSTPCESLELPLLFGTSSLAANAAAVVIQDDGAINVDVRPMGLAPHKLTIARVEHLVGWPRHWLHVLDLSLAALHTRLLLGEGRQKRRRGKKSPRIHPTAWVENSIIGADVRIEAHASVIDSVIGDGVHVADHSVIHSSVVGAGCRTLVDTHLRRVVAEGGSTLSNLDLQDALLGAQVFITTGVAFFSDGPGKNVVVDGQDSGRAVLSGAIGKGAILGSRALFRSGIALPAGALVVARPGEAVGKMDPTSLGAAGMELTVHEPLV
jgi:carbonic anhydrase/acetyltransferase-like protein (isoleucine patch superfamily)